MFYCCKSEKAQTELEVCGVPFLVNRNDGVVRQIEGNAVKFEGYFETIFFLGMSTDSWLCSDWWGQQEVQYDASSRLFLGDRVGRIRVIFEGNSEELIPVIFGVNVFNYNLFTGGKPHEGEIRSMGGPYDEPFRSDKQAAKLLHASLILNENRADSAEKLTKWVFAYKPRSDKKVVSVEWANDSKRAGFLISGITGITSGNRDTTGLRTADLRFFLSKAYYRHCETLKRRLYQYSDEIPNSVPLLSDSAFDAPDIRFYNKNGLDLFTNVYRKNIMDMAHHKIDSEGMPHTSSPGGQNFGSYVGFGTFRSGVDSYSSEVWSRDIGRLLIEITDTGFFDQARAAVEKLHEMLYYPSIRFKIPHWKRVANRIAKDENDLWNEGNENDGHASLMLAVYNLYRKGAVDLEWLRKNEAALKAAADYYLWQEKHPEESNFHKVLYTHSETSTQGMGGYDLYSNIISAFALRMYALLFEELGNSEYANELQRLAERLKSGAEEFFLMEHSRYGKVWTDTTDDCWTYEYKRFAEALIAGDCLSLDLSRNAPLLFDRLRNTFFAEKEVYYNPFSGRQMGYGQGYLTNAALLLDLTEEYTECVNASAMLCYHHTDVPYTVPEGVITHGSGQYWFRNSDLGNAVQQAEIIKEIRLMIGVDDLDLKRRFCIIPRLPTSMTAIEVSRYPVRTEKGTDIISFKLERSRRFSLYAWDSKDEYSIELISQIKPEYIRFGPFDSDNIQTNGKIAECRKINQKYYLYVSLPE